MRTRPRQKASRNTRQRRWILGLMQRSTRSLTLGDICARLKQTKRPVFLSTVYRNMERFAAQGLVRKVNEPGDRKTRYEYKHTQHHHHVVCLGCNKVVHFDACPMDEAFRKKLQEETRFQVQDHTLAVYGLCPACQPA